MVYDSLIKASPAFPWHLQLSVFNACQQSFACGVPHLWSRRSFPFYLSALLSSPSGPAMEVRVCKSIFLFVCVCMCVCGKTLNHRGSIHHSYVFSLSSTNAELLFFLCTSPFSLYIYIYIFLFIFFLIALIFFYTDTFHTFYATNSLSFHYSLPQNSDP